MERDQSEEGVRHPGRLGGPPSRSQRFSWECPASVTLGVDYWTEREHRASCMPMSTWSHEQINSRLDVLSQQMRAAIRAGADAEWPIAIAVIAGVAGTIGMISFTSFVIGSHADGYRDAGVPAGQAAAGAIVAQVFVAAAAVATVLLFRASRVGASRILAAVATGLLILFAVLPNVVGGSSRLTTFLAVLTALLLHVLVGTVAGVVALLSRARRHT